MDDERDTQFDQWKRRCSGELVPITSEPEAGFYELYYRRTGQRSTVAMWQDPAGKWSVLVDGKAVETPADEMWLEVAMRPITYTTYRDVSLLKRPWPHEPVASSTLHARLRARKEQADAKQ